MLYCIIINSFHVLRPFQRPLAILPHFQKCTPGAIQLSTFNTLLIFKNPRMAFEIREFTVDSRGENSIWKFKLRNPTVSRADFFSEEQSTRSLFHLTQDFANQIETCINRKKKKTPPKDRVIRKLC